MAPTGQRKGKIRQRTMDKMQFAVRLLIGAPHLSSAQIAEMIGVSPTRLSIMQRHPLWQKIHVQYTTGVITRLDQKTDANYELAKQNMEFAVPLAMQTLVQQALNAKDERVKNKACNDILDRDGHFAKVSRHAVEVKENAASTDKDNEDAAALVKALQDQKNAAVLQAPVDDGTVIQ